MKGRRTRPRRIYRHNRSLCRSGPASRAEQPDGTDRPRSGGTLRRHQPSSVTTRNGRGPEVRLNVSRTSRKKRFLERRERPEKNWNFSFAIIEERKHWREYQEAFEQMIQHTSTKWAPWWVIPADHKWVTRALVAGIIARSIEKLGVDFPKVSETDLARLAAARTELAAQG